MKKFFLKLLILCLAVCTTLCVFVACGGNADEGEDGHDTPVHTCVFDKEVTTDDYKKSDATCTEKAKYYYSCECGEKGDLTFEYGNFAEHEYVENKCKWCEVKAPSQGLEYTLINNDTEYEVSGIGTCTDVDVVIPSMYLNKPVTSIGTWAFSYCTSLKSIVIPDSVTSIGASAFYNCTSLTSVTFEEGSQLTSIGNSAFYNCSMLESIEIPDSVTSIGVYEFEYCTSLTYNIKDGLKYLGNEQNPYLYLAGVESTNITTATIDSNCRFIGYCAFSYCTSLESIEIPDSVTSIGASAFYNCTSLESIEIPDSVTSIGSSAFSYCTSLESIEIPDSVTSIGFDAFSYCTSLESIEIPDSVTSIGSDAFYGCSSLTIYCEVESKPSGWDSIWNSSNRPVVWGYKG